MIPQFGPTVCVDLTVIQGNTVYTMTISGTSLYTPVVNLGLEYLKEVLQAIIMMYHAQQMICGKNGYEYVQQV